MGAEIIMETKSNLSIIDHIAIQVEDVKKSAQYYLKRFNCNLKYEDETWALLSFQNINLALVTKTQHPNHFAIVDTELSLSTEIKYHRDGIGYVYTEDPDSNSIEIIDRQS